jgi:phthiocerol/phenolphthiocerol synthesis type-I polyketide synthase A
VMAGWLADHGARRLLLAGRTALPPRRDWNDDVTDPVLRQRIAAIRALELRGVSVEAVALDVASREDVVALLDHRDHNGAPLIRGVIHAAGVTGDQLLTKVTDDQRRKVLAPKVGGAQVLHEVFPPGTLEFLYLTASAGSVFGVPGQGSYAAANAYLDALARERRNQGCHTLSLDWVAWQGLGFASGATLVADELRRSGSRELTPGEAFAAWDFAHTHDVAQAVVLPVTVDEIAADGGGSPVPTRDWSGLSRDAIRKQLEDGLRNILAHELRLPVTEIESERPFAELGLNSIMAMSIRRDAEQLVGVELSATMLWNHPTLASLADHLVKRIAPQPESAPQTASDEPSGSVLDSLFDSIESVPASSESSI